MALFLAIGVVFGAVAGIMAFIITWLEYRRHKLKGWRLWKPCLSVAGATFVFFALLAVGFGTLLMHIL